MAERRRLDELRIDRSAEPPENPWQRRLLLLGASVVLVVLAAWWFLTGDARELETATVVEAQAGAARASVLDASGYVVARRQATVASKITGRLVEVAVEEGMSVEEGQILARLDDSNARHALQLSEAQLAAAESTLREIEVRLKEAGLDLGRSRALAAQGVVSRRELDAAQAARDSFAARLAATRDQAKVAEREVALAPPGRRGHAGARAVPRRRGLEERAAGRDRVTHLGRRRLHAHWHRDDRRHDVARDRGRRERVVHPARAAEPAGGRDAAGLSRMEDPAHVITTVPAADRQKATVKVRIAFNELGDPRILPDMGVKVGFQAEPSGEAVARPGLRISERAVRREKDGGVVFVIRDDDRVERRAVSVGGAAGSDLEIRSGLRAGDRVVLDPPADLADGSRVRLRGGE